MRQQLSSTFLKEKQIHYVIEFNFVFCSALHGFAASPITFISHECKHSIQFLNKTTTSGLYRLEI